ncbi:hypothetical protein R3P38DRAFT_3173425 [Favolaschia claudopus]|uniref:Uncharacterized protein n=1 Tax=Favolaschia claudopus TaxID=2862362 RepID=A0AAW0DF10_9AGAR
MPRTRYASLRRSLPRSNPSSVSFSTSAARTRPRMAHHRLSPSPPPVLLQTRQRFAGASFFSSIVSGIVIAHSVPMKAGRLPVRFFRCCGATTTFMRAAHAVADVYLQPPSIMPMHAGAASLLHGEPSTLSTAAWHVPPASASSTTVPGFPRPSFSHGTLSQLRHFHPLIALYVYSYYFRSQYYRIHRLSFSPPKLRRYDAPSYTLFSGGLRRLLLLLESPRFRYPPRVSVLLCCASVPFLDVGTQGALDLPIPLRCHTHLRVRCRATIGLPPVALDLSIPAVLPRLLRSATASDLKPSFAVLLKQSHAAAVADVKLPIPYLTYESLVATCPPRHPTLSSFRIAASVPSICMRVRALLAVR